MYHPFRELRALGHAVTFSVQPTPGNKPAWWCPASSHILMRPGLTQAERRSHLAHELAHRDLDHSGCEGGKPKLVRHQEREADELAARRLITLDAFIDALVWSDCPAEISESLWVTEHMVMVRASSMYGGERLRVATELRRRLPD